MERLTNFKIYNPVKGKKVFVIKSDEFTKIVKYSLTKDGNKLLNDEYIKYNILKKNNHSQKYYFENFNQIITLDNVKFPSIISLNIIENNIIYNVEINTELLIMTDDDIDYYTNSNQSENMEDDIEQTKKKEKYVNQKILNEFVIKNMNFIICDYDKRKVTVDNYIYKNPDIIEEHINLISSILSKLDILYDEQHFIHGDFKLDNILVKDNIPYFYDLEFSLLLKSNTIRIDSKVVPRLNLYLGLANGVILTKDFLHLFDYYLFTITIFSYYVEMKKEEIMLKLFEEKSKKYGIEYNMKMFYYIYNRLYKYFNKKNKISVETMLNHCDYLTIRRIIKSKVGLMGLLTNSPEYQIQKIYGIMYDINNL